MVRSQVDRSIDAAGAYQIGPEDVLDISVWKIPELSRTMPVRPDGKVSLPLVNDIQAAGLTPGDPAQNAATARLWQVVPAPKVSVIVRRPQPEGGGLRWAVKETPGRYGSKAPGGHSK